MMMKYRTGAMLVLSLLLLDSRLNAQPPTDFESRCFHPDVILCDPLDTDGPWGDTITADTPHAQGLPFDGQYRDWRWIEQRGSKGIMVPPVMDTEVKASGTGSLKFTIPSTSGGGASGYFQTNFTPDNSVQFGEGETFFVQWRQRFSYDMIFDEDGSRRRYKVTSGQGGFKTIIINAGDHSSLEFPVSSCTRQHIVFNNRAQWGAIAGYHSCGRYTGFHKRLASVGGSIQLDYQPGGVTDGCLRRDPITKQLRQGAGENCQMFFADEWMTFQVQVNVGKWGGSGEDISNIKLWVAREGQASRLVIDHNFVAQAPEDPVMKYGKVWLLPYHTAKDPDEVHPEAYTWYDELIVSRARIADPTPETIPDPDPDPDPDPIPDPELAQCKADLDRLQGDFDALLSDFDILMLAYNALLEPIDPIPGVIPSHIADASAGEWTAIGSNTLRDVAFDYVANPFPPAYTGTNVAGLMKAWSGGVYADNRCTLYVTGGGHNDYDGNEWYGFDLCGNKWERVNDPSPYEDSRHPGVFPDGAPEPVHTYGMIAYNSDTDRLYRFARTGSPLRYGFSFNPDTGEWIELAHLLPDDPHSSSIFWNPTLGEFWGIHKNQGNWGITYSYDLVTPFKQRAGSVTTKAGAAAFSDERQEILFKTQGNASTHGNYAALDITQRKVTKLFTVSPPPIHSAHGLVWDSVRDRWVAWHGGATMYSLYPNEINWVSETPVGGVTPSAGQKNGTFGRFQYIREFDVFIGVNSVDESVFMFKPLGWSPE